MPEQSSFSIQNKPSSPSELFTVWVWREVLDDHFEWRGKVLHSGSRKARYFREWQTLLEFIKNIIEPEQ
jgi:hypothetical protein